MSSTGALSSIGMGSGVLTSSVIDQLKANDTTLTITPIDNKIATNTQKQQAMSLLNSLATSLDGAVSSLQNDTLYQQRTVAGSNTGVSVTANAGVGIQNFTIANTKLATTSVSESGTFSASTNPVATGAGNLNINVNGTDYKIAYTASMTYDDLKTKINDVAGTDLTASILQTSNSGYSLVFNSDNTGANQQITLTDLSGNLNANLQSDALKSDAFTSASATVSTNNTPGTLTLKAGSVSKDFSYTGTTNLNDLASMINADSTVNTSVTARVIKNDVGTYNLVLTAKGAAENQPITLTDSIGGSADTKLLSSGTATATSGNISNIQAASDASLSYNGITITRSTNNITDITAGVTINLLSDGASANIAITQNAQPIQDAMNSFVSSYNAMNTQLTSMTQKNTTTNVEGLFNGDSSINGIDRAIKNIITSSDSSGLSLTQYGINVNQDGTLSFDSTAFSTKMAASPDAMAKFFSGTTTVDAYGNSTTTDGVFNTLYTNLNNLTSSNGVLANLTTGLTTEATSLTDNKTRATDALNARYSTMTQQFIAYDAIMTNLTSQFASLKQTILTATNGTPSN